MYWFTLIGQDGNVFDEIKTEDYAAGEQFSKGRGMYFDVYSQSYKRYTVDVCKWSDVEDCWIPFKRYRMV